MAEEELLLQQEALILRVQRLEKENAELRANSLQDQEEEDTIPRERGGSIIDQLADGAAVVADGALQAIQGAGEVFLATGARLSEVGQSVAYYDEGEEDAAEEVGILPDFSQFWETVSTVSFEFN